MSDVRINHVALSQSRLARIEGAQTLNEAQRMGLFDRAVDWFRGGVKKEAIKQAFDLLRSPAGEGSASPAQHQGLLPHFNVLQSALRAEHADKCQLSVQRDDDTQTWSYRMEIDGKTLVSASGLPVQSGHTLAAFEDQVLLANLGNYLQQEFGADSVDQRQALQERFAAINTGHAQLAGDAAASATLEKFRVVCAGLEDLDVARQGCRPSVELASDLATAELCVGRHVLAKPAISSRAVLTDTLTTMARVSAGAVDQMLGARDVHKAVLDTVQDMVDDKKERKVMQGNIDDRLFCSQNFAGARVLAGDDSKFEATFRDKSSGGQQRTLVFSNRMVTNSELRGANLQSKLATGDYDTLADLISQRFGGAEDSDIPYMTNVARMGISSALSCLEEMPNVGDRLGFPDEAAVHTYCEDLKSQVFSSIKVGRTDLAQVWHLDTTAFGSMRQPAPDQDPRARAAGPVPQRASAESQPQEMAMLVTYKA